MKDHSLLLRGGDSIRADYIVSCTGWGDHFGLFDAETKAELGLPAFGDIVPEERYKKDVAWEGHDVAASKTINDKLPFLTEGPELRNPKTNDSSSQRRWRLYKRSIPLKLAIKNDRSLVILGQIHTIQTPLVSEVQSFYNILYLLGKVNLPSEATMTKEIAEWNAWTRKRYISQGQKYPYCIFDFLPVCFLSLLSPFLFCSFEYLVTNYRAIVRGGPPQGGRRQYTAQEQHDCRVPCAVQASGLLRIRG